MQAEAEAEQLLKLRLLLDHKNEDSVKMLEQLKVEEEAARIQLDLKIDLEQKMEDLNEEADTVAKKRADNREEILRQQIKLSQLTKANEVNKEELDRLTTVNTKLEADNTALDEKNKKLDSEIAALIQRIDINTLLREVDMQELEIIAKNTDDLDKNVDSILRRWDMYLKKKDDE